MTTPSGVERIPKSRSGRGWRARSTTVSLLVLLACNAKTDPNASQVTPNGDFTLTPSLHEGGLIRLTVKDRSGNVIDDVPTRESNLMKWVTGWVNNSSY